MNLCESFLFRKVSIFGILTMVKVICTMTCVRTCVRDYLCVHVWECAHARVWRKIGFFPKAIAPSSILCKWITHLSHKVWTSRESYSLTHNY